LQFVLRRLLLLQVMFGELTAELLDLQVTVLGERRGLFAAVIDCCCCSSCCCCCPGFGC
jgi:hypothetical protein